MQTLSTLHKTSINNQQIDKQNYCIKQAAKMRRIQSENLQNINLLDVILNAKQSQRNIYTFQDFKQWFNGIDLNETLVQPIKKSKLQRPESFQFEQSTFNIRHTTPAIRENFGGQYLLSGPILELGLKKKKQVFQSHAQLQLEEVPGQNSFRESSAKSSRSFNGYQQINQYEIRNKLGKGAFSQVYEGIDVDSEDKKKYALKIMESKRLKRQRLRKSSFQLKQNLNIVAAFAMNQVPLQSSFRDDQPQTQFVNNEIAILKKIDHQYITKLYEVIMDRQKGKVYLVLEYCENGFICENKNKLSKGGHSYRKLLESQCRRYFKQLVLAIDYIHTFVKIAHRDIKPENILISKNDQVKLSDFGLGTNQLQTDQYSGTRLFMPPESSGAQGKKTINTQTADIWAMGVTLLIMLTGSTPDYRDNAIVDLNKRIEELKDVSSDLKHFMRRCLETDPQKRINSDQMLTHPWIAVDDPFGLLIKKSLAEQFEIVVSKDQEQNAIKEAEIRKPRQKNYAIKTNLAI